MTGSKWGAVVTYIAVFAAAMLNPGTEIADGAALFFGALAAVHLLECVVVLRWLKEFDGPLSMHLGHTFLFGFLHWLPLYRAQQDSQG